MVGKPYGRGWKNPPPKYKKPDCPPKPQKQKDVHPAIKEVYEEYKNYIDDPEMEHELTTYDMWQAIKKAVED